MRKKVRCGMALKEIFLWVERKTYKMHVRVFLSKYRGYFVCSECNGTRMRREAEFWKWKKFTLPELYSKTVGAFSILPKKLKATLDLKIRSL